MNSSLAIPCANPWLGNYIDFFQGKMEKYRGIFEVKKSGHHGKFSINDAVNRPEVYKAV